MPPLSQLSDTKYPAAVILLCALFVTSARTQITPAPANDNFANAQAISGLAGRVTGSNEGATKEPGEPNHAGQPGGASVWYRWQAPASGLFGFTTIGSDFNTLLAVYTGSRVGALAEVASNDNRLGASVVTFNAVAGASYQIAVDSVSPLGRHTLVLNWFPSPANDNFANAQVIGGPAGSVTGSNIAATREVGEPRHAGNAGGASVWYRWQAPSNGPFTFTTFGSNFDTLLAVYAGSSLNTLTPIVSNDDRLRFTSSVTFNALAGMTYRVAVDGYNGDFGNLALNWTAAPPNDNFANAQPISGSAGNLTGSNAGATKETGEPNHAGNAGGASVWYRWQAPSSGGVTFTTSGSEINTLLAVYTGGSVNTLARIASNDDLGLRSQTSLVNFNAQAGVVYYLAVDGFDGITGGIALKWLPSFANDNFANAQPISGSSGSVTGNNVGATKEAGEPNHADNAGGASVWYRWTAPTSGPFIFNTLGSNFNTLLAVYTGVSVGALTPVGSAVGAQLLSFRATAGVTYSIAVDGYRGDGGLTDTGVISLNWTTSPANDNFASAQMIAGSSGSVTGSNAGATRELGEPNHAGVAGQASVWYRWQAPSSGAIAFATIGSSFDTLLAVYTGNSVGALTEVASNDDRLGTASLVSFNAIAGQTYRIAVDGRFTGDIVLKWFPAPTNDNFANAQIISGNRGSVTGSNLGATKEPGEPNHAGQAGGVSVWYRWQAPVSGAFTFNTIGSDFNTLLSAGTSFFFEIVSNNDRLGLVSSVTFPAVAGATYYIAVDGKNGAMGNIVLTWSPTLLPTNDNFANAQVIGGGSGSAAGSNVGATREAGEPNHAGQAANASVWYRWAAPASGPAVFTTFGSGFQTLLAVYTGASVTALTPVASTTGAQLLSFNATAGVTYSIAVDGDVVFDGYQEGELRLSWRLGAVANDNFANAQAINGRTGSMTGNNLGATKEPGEPSHAGNTGGASIWYRWQAPGGGNATFTTLGSNFNTLLAVYTGASVSTLSPIASNDDFLRGTSSVTFAAVPGVTYYFAVDGFRGQTGAVMLTWNLGAPINDNFSNAQTISGNTGIVGGNNLDATKEPGEPNHAGNPGGHSIWYRWQAPGTGPVTFTTAGSSLDTVLAVYTGTSVNALTTIASNDDEAGTSLLTSKVTFNAVAGTVYSVAVDGLAGRTGNIFLRWSVGARISGQVSLISAVTGRPVTGLPFATLVLSGDDSQTVVADASGYYTFANLRIGGNYTVTAFPTGKGFAEKRRSYTPLLADVDDADFNFGGNVLHTLSISGQVKNAKGAGLSGVTIVLSGAFSTTQVTDATGNYDLPDLFLSNDSYIVTPSSPTYSFTPPRRIFGNLAGDVLGADFTAGEAYTISGQVREGNGAPLGGTTITLLGSQAPPAQTDANGNYSFTVPAGGNYTVVAARAGYTFNQPSQTFTTLSQNQKTVDFIAALITYAISGRVSVGATGLSGVSMRLSGAASSTILTDTSGNYSFSGLAPGGSYMVTPARPNFIFSPPPQTFTNLSQDQTANFNATPPTVTILATDPTASEPGTDTGTFTLTRTGPPDAALTVNYTISGTATNGVDYELIPSSVTIPAGATTATIVIRPIDDTLVEGPETVTLTLTSGADYQVGSPNAATVTIADDDVPTPTLSGLQYYPLGRPVRLLDTRPGFSACDSPGALLAAAATRTEAARVNCEGLAIPAAAQAVVGNATVVNLDSSGKTLSAGGYVTLYPSGAAMPTVSNLNYGASQVVANAFTVGLGADGAFNLFASGGTHVIVDVTGYYAPPGAGGLYYHPLPRPVRLLDTRPGFSACDSPGALLAAAATRTEAARVNCEGLAIPAAAQAIVGNATVVNLDSSGKTISGGGYLTLYPSGAAMPTVSNLNYGASQVVANAFTVGLGADGAFNLFASGGTHVIIDVTGYYSAEATDVNGAGLLYQPLGRPVRLLDTRPGFSACDSPGALLAAAATRTEAARVNCEGLAIPAAAQAVVGNATVVNLDSSGRSISGGGYLTLYPSGAAMPTVSNLNYGASQVVANAFTVGLGADGAFNIFASGGTHVIIDVTGYYAAAGAGSLGVPAADSDSTASKAVGNLPAGNDTLPARATDTSSPTPTSSPVSVALSHLVTSVSAANYSASALATESIVAAFGLDLAATTEAATAIPLPTTLAGTTVSVKDAAGTERLAPLFFVSPAQVNYQIPLGTLTGPATITVTREGTRAAVGTVEVTATGPGLFAVDGSGTGVAAAVVQRVKADGTLSFEPVGRFEATENRFVATPIDLGSATDQVFLVLYGTGIRHRSSLAAVSSRIGEEEAEVLYAGEQGGLVGLDQVNLRLPRSLAGRGVVEVVLKVDGQPANSVRVKIK